MDAFVIYGGRRLNGRVRINGSKNASLPLLAASLLTDEPVILRDVPDLADIRNMIRLLRSLGCEINRDETAPGKPLTIQVTDTSNSFAHYDIVRTMRASICVLGPLLGQRGFGEVSMPGGCAIGDRPVDLHLRGFEALSAGIHLESGNIIAKAPAPGRLIGGSMFLGGPFGSTVLGTANVLCAAVRAKGTTVIESAACEPEIVDLANMLTKMGAKIVGAGSPRLVIEGVDRLGGVDHTVMADRIEAGTYILASAITNGNIVLENCPMDSLAAPLFRLAQIGVDVESVGCNGNDHPLDDATIRLSTDNGNPRLNKSNGNGNGSGNLIDPMRQTVRVTSNRRLDPIQMVTQPYPGFPTDLQAQLMALLCLADGNSVVTEKIFPDRFMHVPELLRMGAKLYRNGASVLISGVRELIGAPVMASDLRASAGLILAALAARGMTTVHRIYHLDRGYERMELTLRQLGADIERVDEEELNKRSISVPGLASAVA